MIHFGITDKGLVRTQNQDCICLPEEKDNIKLYIIADGMGGANAGDVASQKAIEFVKEHIQNNFSSDSDAKIKKLIKDALYIANKNVYELSLQNKEYSGMGTTIIILVIVKEKMYIGHIGDSSLYRIRKNIIRKITKDHSYVQQLIDDKTITKKEARNHPKKNMLMKVLGCEPIVEPDIMMKKVEPGDYILMCTDGLTNLLNDKEIMLTITTLKDCKLACNKLIELANSRGGYDNISTILICNE